MPQRPTCNSRTPSPPASSRRSRSSGGGGGISPAHEFSVKPAARRPEAGSRKPEACTPWIAESKLPPNPTHPAISNVRKILLTSPYFPRFYTDIILHYLPNSNEAKILRPHYQKICEKVNVMSKSNGDCAHIKVTGVPCGSPALKGEQFCYFHQNAHRGVRRPKQSRLHPIAMIEDEESIQYALMEVINALMRNTIDYKRANLIIRALHIAVKNSTRVKYSNCSSSMVTDIPDYAEPTSEHAELMREADLPAVTEAPYKPVEPSDIHYWEDQYQGRRVNAREAEERRAAELKFREAKAREEGIREGERRAQARVGADPLVRPASPSEARASVPAAESSTPTKPAGEPAAVPPHNFKPAQPTPTPKASESTAAAPTRKPPQPAASQAPKERKNGARACPEQSRRGASRG